ncbi:MAG: hypothetical protein ACHQAU_05220 [Gammaproteobacteria bacterium]|jgi:hypothetical protein|nr:hypothetical protein [Gammaproteobacteria bacterium]
MRHGGLVVIGLVTAMVMAVAGCSGSGDAYALRGTPTPRSGTDTGNFLISGKTCKYVTMVGFYSDAQVLTYPCKVIADEDDALGDPHAHMTIEITTAKGTVTAKIDGSPSGMNATQAPDLGNQYPFPPNWSVAPLAPAVLLRNNDNSATQVVLSIAGGECAMTINNSAVNCGLAFWSDGSYSVWVPGLLVNADYASYVIGLSFGKTSPGQWAMPRPLPGFPATYGEVQTKK